MDLIRLLPLGNRLIERKIVQNPRRSKVGMKAAHLDSRYEGGKSMATAPVIRSDELIQNDVMFELKWDPRILPNEIGVAVKERMVTLMGSVDSYTKRWAAEAAALRVHGVKAVVNEIEVKLPVAEERSDEDIASAAIQALTWDSAVPEEKINVAVAKGWVTLRGDVEWQYQ